ncbi:hypothetical protein P7K49_040222, partial [Saguinus oedipus]
VALWPVGRGAPAIPPMAEPRLSTQSPQLPEDGTLMAVYDKSGFSHSETSLVAVIYLSRQVRPLPHPSLPAGLCSLVPEPDSGHLPSRTKS